MTYDVTGIGVLNIDMFIRGDGPAGGDIISEWVGPAAMTVHAAGALGYVLRNLAHIGLQIQACSCLPGDVIGAFIFEELSAAGIDTQGIRQVPGASAGLAVYILLFGSRKRPLAYQLPTHSFWPLELSKQEREQLLDTRLLHHAGYLHYQAGWQGVVTELLHEAHGRGILTTMDPQFPLIDLQPPWMAALEDVLPYVDVFFCDETEAQGITACDSLEEAAVRILNAGAGTVVIKQGEHGAILYQNGRVLSQPPVEIGAVVDSIGAGDAFDAGYIYGLLDGWPPEACLLFASLCAGFSLTGEGGTQMLPDRATLLGRFQALR